MQQSDIKRRLAAEALGTFFLLIAIVGSGIMGQRLAGDAAALTLLANSLATGAALIVLILVLAPVSGAHFNPAVTLAFLLRREIGPADAATYIGVQLAGGVAGVLAAHAMFSEPLVQTATTIRTGPGLWLAEAIATFGLVAVIFGTMRSRPGAVAYAVGLYIAAAMWFTASTSFANPAVTVARALSDTFTGIAAAGVAPFVAAQLIGATLAALAMGWLLAPASAARRGGAGDLP